jgi:hypothetical protein
MNELVKSGLITAGFTIGIFVVFVVLYWAFRGFLPGSRLVEMPLVAPNELDGKSAKFKLFHTKWCPYSKDAVAHMETFKALIDEKGSTFGGKRVIIELVDCEVKKDDCQLYSVDAYPTYKLETSIKMYEYVGPADHSTYTEFLVKALGKESVA